MSEGMSWQEQNRSYLAAELSRLPAFLGAGGGGGEGPPQEILQELRAAMASPPALDRLVGLFHLSSFERAILLLCAGAELDGEVAAASAEAQGGGSPAPTFGLALARLPEAHWSALSPEGPLRGWRLVDVEGSGLLTRRPLRIDERILHFLVGVHHVDERLRPLVEASPPPGDLAPSHRALAEEVAGALVQASEEGDLPSVRLLGTDHGTKLEVAAAAAVALGLDLFVLRASVLPADPAEIEGLIRLWRRETLLSGRVLLLDTDDSNDAGTASAEAAARFVDGLGGVVFVSSRRRRPQSYRPQLTFEVDKPTPSEQRRLWSAALGDEGSELNGHLDSLVGQFRLEATALRCAARQAMAGVGRPGGSRRDLAPALWSACRRQGRRRLDHLAQRIDSSTGWGDLVLAEEPLQALRELAVQVRRRGKVHETWGFARKGTRGLGISALFAGVSGTGKTLAAEVLANELQLDLYRIDLAAVISKYIGETEKNLRRVFDAAEGGGVVLLFDEADALFGKRSEVKDSHDRYANVEISYLLQRMEAYQGLAILTTNMKSTLDSAFLRRLRSVVEFAFPGPEERAEIWRRVFPSETPTRGLDVDKLARLNVAGGNIRSIALGAAFAAADEGRAVGMEHLLRAARAEYRKLEKPLNEVEIRGWLE